MRSASTTGIAPLVGLRLRPDDGTRHLAIAALWLEAGEPDRADDALTEALAMGAIDDNSAARHRAEAQTLRQAPRAAAGYVRHLFNQFAADYDTRMQQRLGYAAPSLLRNLAGMLIDPRTKLDVLDLGCGTGLSGLAFRENARCMFGVDLSPRMLEKARETGAYDKLVEGDAETLPAGLEGPFDLVIAADVLVYLGELDNLFVGVRSRLRKTGLFLFTTERGEFVDYELGPKRRFRHHGRYLRDLANQHGFDVASLVECLSRYEAGIGVSSWAAAFRAI